MSIFGSKGNGGGNNKAAKPTGTEEPQRIYHGNIRNSDPAEWDAYYGGSLISKTTQSMLKKKQPSLISGKAQ